MRAATIFNRKCLLSQVTTKNDSTCVYTSTNTLLLTIHRLDYFKSKVVFNNNKNNDLFLSFYIYNLFINLTWSMYKYGERTQQRGSMLAFCGMWGRFGLNNFRTFLFTRRCVCSIYRTIY